MGASPIRTFFKITLPLIAPGVITAGAIAFTFAATNFTIPWLMGANDKPVAVYIYPGYWSAGLLAAKRRCRCWSCSS